MTKPDKVVGSRLEEQYHVMSGRTSWTCLPNLILQESAFRHMNEVDSSPLEMPRCVLLFSAPTIYLALSSAYPTCDWLLPGCCFRRLCRNRPSVHPQT